MAKTWKEKLNPTANSKTVVLESDFAGIKQGETMFVATPLIVKAFIETMPYGTAITPLALRVALAEQNKADATCPVSTGIFLRIIAENALEELKNGKALNEVTPFWRVIEPNSVLAKKLSCDTSFIKEMRELEAART